MCYDYYIKFDLWTSEFQRPLGTPEDFFCLWYWQLNPGPLYSAPYAGLPACPSIHPFSFWENVLLSCPGWSQIFNPLVFTSQSAGSIGTTPGIHINFKEAFIHSSWPLLPLDMWLSTACFFMWVDVISQNMLLTFWQLHNKTLIFSPS